MRLANTRAIRHEPILAQTIYNENGVVLLQQGMHLTKRIMDRLGKQGVTYIYIEDENTSDIHPEPALSEKLRMKATRTLKKVFSNVKESDLSKRSYILDRNDAELTDVVNQIILEVQGNEKSLSLLSDIYISDDYIFQHSLNVTIYSLAIGVEMGFSRQELISIGVGAMLHDIGKIFIDRDILLKADKLTDAEFAVIKSHAQIGFDFLRQHPDIPGVVAHCAYQHHERLDGSGYPRGIAGEEIHSYAKLIGIADVFDAVTSNRVYREAMLPHEGLEILYAGAINLFDKTLIEAFKKSIAVYPAGLTVGLNWGREGVVLRQNREICDRPVIRILKENGQELAAPYELDLLQEPAVMVEFVTFV